MSIVLICMTYLAKLLQHSKMQEAEVLMRHRILKQMRILLLCNNVLFVHSSASILCMLLLRLSYTTDTQYKKMDYHVLSQYSAHFPERWKELAQTPGQKLIDTRSFVDTQKIYVLAI